MSLFLLIALGVSALVAMLIVWPCLLLAARSDGETPPPEVD